MEVSGWDFPKSRKICCVDHKESWDDVLQINEHSDGDKLETTE